MKKFNNLDDVSEIHSWAIRHDPKDIVYVTWVVTTTCNFECSYCPTELHDGEYGFPEYENIISFIETLSDSLPEKAFINFELLGGEPTMWPRLIDFFTDAKEYFKENKQTIVFQVDTNASRTNRWWQKFKEANLHDVVAVNTSFHADFCDPDLFYSNLEIISPQYNTHANLMLDPRHFDKVTKLLEKINKNLPVSTATKLLRPNLGNAESLVDGYTEHMLEYIRNNKKHKHHYDEKKWKVPGAKTKVPMSIIFNGEEANWQNLVLRQGHSMTGWKCSAGSRRFFIEPNGDILPCSKLITKRITLPGDVRKRDYDAMKKNPYLMGNVNKRDFKIFKNYIVCPEKWCSCKMDALAHKFRTPKKFTAAAPVTKFRKHNKPLIN